MLPYGCTERALKEAATTVFCTQCGQQNPEDSRFCARCGAPVGRPGDVAGIGVETTSTISLSALEGALDNNDPPEA